MTKRAVLATTISTLLAGGVLLAQTTTSKLSARELYYNPVKRVSAVRTAPRGPAVPQSPAPETKQPEAGAGAPSPAAQAQAPGPDVALAMRYRLRKKLGSQFEEVDSDTTFHSGDYIKIDVAVNAPAYVYVAQIGSSGKWTVLFPDNRPDANSLVKEKVDVELPSLDSGFRFDETPGIEQVFVAASRQPIKDLEQVISARKSPASAPSPAPNAQRAQPLIASLPIDNTLIAAIRLQARDLVVQKVDAVSSGTTEHAVYIASAPDSNMNMVIADLKLNHQR